MLSKSKDCIAVSICDDFFRAVQIKGSGSGAKVTHVASQNLQGIPSDKVSKTIQAALKGFQTKKSEIVFVVSPSKATTKNIEVPSVSDDEIRSIVNLQAGRHTPFSRDEIQVSFVNIGVFKSNYTKVLLVIANRNQLKNHIDVLEKAGLTVQTMLFGPEGSAAFYSNILNLQGSPKPTGLIDIDRNSTEFIFMKGGKPIATRNIPVGRMQLSKDGEGARNTLIEELKKTVDSFKSDEIDAVPELYILTTDDALTQDLKPVLENKLGWSVDIRSYVDGAKVAGPALKSISTVSDECSFLDLIACAKGAARLQVNLLPDEVKLQKTVQDQASQVVRLGILVTIIVVLIVGSIVAELYFKSNFLNRLKNDYSANRQEVAALERLSEKSKLIRNYLDSRLVSLDIINELYKNVPGEIYLTTIAMDEEGNIQLQGISDIASLVFNLGSSLKDAELFKSVNIESTTSKKDRGKDVSAFEITLKLFDAPEDEAGEGEEQISVE